MLRIMIVVLSLASIAGCTVGLIGTNPPLDESGNNALLLSRANDGASAIQACTVVHQYTDGASAAVNPLWLFATEHGVYAASWDRFNGAYGLTMRLQAEEIQSVTFADNTLGVFKLGNMLVIKSIYGNEYGFVSLEPNSPIEQAIRRLMATPAPKAI